jgi:hypothetical protein
VLLRLLGSPARILVNPLGFALEEYVALPERIRNLSGTAPSNSKPPARTSSEGASSLATSLNFSFGWCGRFERLQHNRSG